MSETVNDIHGYPRKNRNCSTPLKKTKSKWPDKSPPDTLKPEFSKRVSQRFHNRQSSLEVDNPPFGDASGHEVFKMSSEPVDGIGGEALENKASEAVTAGDDPQEIKLPKIESEYFDLIKAGRRDQITLEPEDVEVEVDHEHELIKELAKSLSGRDQGSSADLKKEPVADQMRNQRVDIDRLQKTPASDVWARRVKFGSAAMLAAGIFVVLMVNSQEFPKESDNNTEVALATNFTGLKPDPVVMEKIAAASSLPAEVPAEVKGSEAANVTRFVPPPILADVSEAKSRPDNGPGSQAEQARVIEIEKLSKNLKIVRAYLSSQQLAYSEAALEEKPLLLQEVTKIKNELTSLVEKINALQAPAVIDPSTQVARISPAPGEIKKVELGAISEDDSGSAGATVALPVTSSKPRKTRDPEKVELALAAMPGLYRLQPVSRSRLKEKLISGECLVPALSSVFQQVPTLVMRDMMRQFDGQC